MKKFLVLLIAILFALTACSTSDEDSNSVATKNDSASVEGWYSYTASASGVTQTYFFYYDKNQELTRAGSDLQEWTGSVFSTLKDSYGYDSIKDDLVKVTDESKLPAWAKNASEGNNNAEKQTVIVTFDLNYPENQYISSDNNNEYFGCVNESYRCSGITGDLAQVYAKENPVTLGDSYTVPTTTPTLEKSVYSHPVSFWGGSPYYIRKDNFEYDTTIYQYDFVSWNTKADGTGLSYSAETSFQPNSDTKLYAIYKTSYSKIAYAYYGGIAVFYTKNEWKYSDNEESSLAFYEDGTCNSYWIVGTNKFNRTEYKATWSRSTEDGKKYVSVNGKKIEYEIDNNTLTLKGKLFSLFPEKTTWTRTME